MKLRRMLSRLLGWGRVAGRRKNADVGQRSRGLIVAVLGPDGAGKTTLAARLVQVRMLRARRIYLGTNLEAGDTLRATRWIHALTDGLSGRAPRGLRLGVKALRFTSRVLQQRYRHVLALQHSWRGGLVVFDRYDADVQLGAGNDTSRVRRWLMHGGAPAPDILIVLDAPGPVLFARKREHSAERLEEMRRSYAGVTASHGRVLRIDASADADAVLRHVVSVLRAQDDVSAAASIDGRNVPGRAPALHATGGGAAQRSVSSARESAVS